MSRSDSVVTRRDFIRKAARASFAVAIGLPITREQETQATPLTDVALVRHPDAAVSSRDINEDLVVKMLDDAVCTLAGDSDPEEAWRRFIKPDDVVGVKSNVWGPLPTPTVLERTIVRRAIRIGVDEKDISVDDRGVLLNRVFRRSTALVNIRPMRTHHWAGVGSCLKNYIMFSDDPPSYHPDSCAGLGALWALPAVKGKTRLNILVMLTPLFHGIGPHHWNVKYTWPYSGIVVGVDPVAVDTVGLKIIQAYRMRYFGKFRPLWPPAKHIAMADSRYGIGTSDLEKIRIIPKGWDEDMLIDES